MTAYGRQLQLLPDPIDVDFADFHERCPEVYDALARLAREWKAAGHANGSIALLWERLRWEMGVQMGDWLDDAPALNNNHRSRYARLLMWNEPDLAGFFQTRQLHTGEVA